MNTIITSNKLENTIKITPIIFSPVFILSPNESKLKDINKPPSNVNTIPIGLVHTKLVKYIIIPKINKIYELLFLII